jgi:glycerol-3-phosphate dehydrogenase
MLEPLVEGVTLTGAEVLWAVRAEGALDVDDVLERRSRVALVPADAARVRAAVTDLVAGAMIRG